MTGNSSTGYGPNTESPTEPQEKSLRWQSARSRIGRKVWTNSAKASNKALKTRMGLKPRYCTRGTHVHLENPCGEMCACDLAFQEAMRSAGYARRITGEGEEDPQIIHASRQPKKPVSTSGAGSSLSFSEGNSGIRASSHRNHESGP